MLLNDNAVQRDQRVGQAKVFGSQFSNSNLEFDPKYHRLINFGVTNEGEGRLRASCNVVKCWLMDPKLGTPSYIVPRNM